MSRRFQQMCTLIRFVTFLQYLVLASQGPITGSPSVKFVQDCLGLHVVDSGFHGLDSSICQWTLDVGFQSFVVFQIPSAVQWVPKSGIPDSRGKIFPHFGFLRKKFLGFQKGIPTPLHGENSYVTIFCCFKTQKSTLQSKKTLE